MFLILFNLLLMSIYVLFGFTTIIAIACAWELVEKIGCLKK